MMKRAIAALLAAPIVVSAAPAPYRVTLANPFDWAITDGLATVKDAPAADCWSVDGTRAQLEPSPDRRANLVFPISLKPRERRVVTLAPRCSADTPAPRVAAVLNVRDGDAYKLADRFDVPSSHRIHDNLIAMEGPGWESDKVGYRLYLDERNVTDIFGKRQPAPVLATIGMGGDNYHQKAPWGMDIFQVDQSLGVGGLGTLRDGKAVQIGPARIEARVEANGPVVARIAVDNRGWAGASGPVDLSAHYAIAAGSRLTMVTAASSDSATLVVAGLTHHAGMTVLRSTKGKWRYVATFGDQSLAKDGLGIAMFYPADEVSTEGDDGTTLYVRFRDPRQIRYAFAAAWSEEPDAPKTLADFRLWLDRTAQELATPLTGKEAR